MKLESAFADAIQLIESRSFFLPITLHWGTCIGTGAARCKRVFYSFWSWALGVQR